MSAFNYSRSKATADRLIARFGSAATLIEPGTPTGPSYDPTPGVPVSHSVNTVVTDYTSREIDGTRILATDRRALISIGANVGATPNAGWSLLFGADARSYSIVAVKPLQPGPTTVLWDAQVRLT